MQKRFLYSYFIVLLLSFLAFDFFSFASSHCLAPLSGVHFLESDESGGELAGKTLLRFAKSYDTKGGLESYLKDLNASLLRKNRMQIIQLYFTDEADLRVKKEKIGLGTLVSVPVPRKYQLQSSDKKNKKIFDQIYKILLKFNLTTLARDILEIPFFSNLFKNIPFVNEYYKRSSQNPELLKEKVRELLKDYKIDLTVIHSVDVYDSLVLAEAVQGIPIILQNHGDNNKLNLSQTKKLISLSSAVSGVSDEKVPAFLGTKFISLSDGVDTDFFSQPQIDLTSNQLYLPARISGQKGHEDCVKIAEILYHENVDFQFVFSGEEQTPGLKQQLKDQISKLGLDKHFVFLDALTQQGMKEQYSKSAMVVLPTKSEGLGRVLIEGSSMQLPVIAYSVGGVPNAIVNNETGFLIKLNDHKAFAGKIKYLLENPQERTRVGVNGRQFVMDKFSLQALTQRHTNLYLKVLNANSGNESGNHEYFVTPVLNAA